MIKRIELKKFKNFEDATINLYPSKLTLLVGGNNSGKSTLLHALATWEFAKTVLIHEKDPKALLSTSHNDGLGISIDDFTPLNIPSFRYLWYNLKITNNYSLTIKCVWDNAGVERYLEIGFSLVQERLFIKKMSSNLVDGDKIPKVAYLPTFAGISSKEQWYSPAVRNKLIGQGLAGAVMRNQIMDMYLINQKERVRLKGAARKIPAADLLRLRKTDPYEILNNVLASVFKCQLYPKAFNPDFHTHVGIELNKGKLEGNYSFKVDKTISRRDIMVEGSGFLQWLSVYTFALSPDIDVLLLDEPDAHLHNSLQETLIAKLLEISDSNNKQVLVATHSVEVIKQFDYERILYMDNPHFDYLSNNDSKQKVLNGIGIAISPKFDLLSKYKKVIFVENESDVNFLKTWANTLGLVWPNDNVIWNRADKMKERKVVFHYLKNAITGIKAISISDRDDDDYRKVRKSLKHNDHGDYSDAQGELRIRVWRRREIESYLFSPTAMARIYERANGVSYVDALNRVNTELAAYSIIPVADYLQSDRSANNQVFFTLDPKLTLDPICSTLGFNKIDIAREMQRGELFEDIVTMVSEVVNYLT